MNDNFISQAAFSQPLNRQEDGAMERPIAAGEKGMVKQLFSKMQGLYGAKFLQQWSAVDIALVHQHWEFAIQKLTQEQFERGMNLLETLDLPPTLPQFLHLCKPPIDPQAAYFEAVEGIAAREHGELGHWSDPAIYWATASIGAFDIKTHPYAQISERWSKALMEAQAQPHEDSIPLPGSCIFTVEAQENPVPHKSSAPEIKKVVQIAKSGSADHDPKRWAKRIQERIAKGDKTVTKQQAEAASKALQ
jgi:hypothetical protein